MDTPSRLAEHRQYREFSGNLATPITPSVEEDFMLPAWN